MADISKIQLPNGNVYNLKDKTSGYAKYFFVSLLYDGTSETYSLDQTFISISEALSAGKIVCVVIDNPVINADPVLLSLQTPEKMIIASGDKYVFSAFDGKLVHTVTVETQGSSDDLVTYETSGSIVTLLYGISTWNDFLDAYNSNKLVFCRAAAYTNPDSEPRQRVAPLSFVSYSATTGTISYAEFTFIYSTLRDAGQQSDKKYVYKLTSSGTWSVTSTDIATEIQAGTGISRSYSNSKLVLANTGVLEFNGQTGSVTYTAPNSFANVKVGNTTIEADSTTDTIELIAGNNITLTPDATNDTVTIAASGGANDFYINLTYDDQQEIYETDKTLTEIDAAFNAGKHLYVIDETQTIEVYNYSTPEYIIAPLSIVPYDDCYIFEVALENGYRVQYLLPDDEDGVAYVSVDRYLMSPTDVSGAAYTSEVSLPPIIGIHEYDGTTYAGIDSSGLDYSVTTGSTSVIGNSTLTIGNSTASGTNGNKQGKLKLYGTSQYAVTLTPAPLSGNRTITLPNQNGTLALNDITVYQQVEGGMLYELDSQYEVETLNDGLYLLDYWLSGYLQDNYQPTLVSGTNIKTINNTSLLGSGNIDIQGGSSYSAGTGISIASDTITNTAPIWHGDDTGTFTTPINADQLEGYTVNTLLKLIYPVGSVYLNINNTNPSTFILGTTWELISSVALASEHVFGNGYALGLTNGNTTKGMASVAYTGGQNNLSHVTTAYGHTLPYVNNSPSGWSGGSGSYIGVSTKTQTGEHPEYSGLISDTITLYTWKRTA